MSALQVSGLTLHFGGVMALEDVELTVQQGEIVGLIGPNGAGKSTLFNCIGRIYRPSRGAVSFGEHDLLKVGPSAIMNLGIVRTFQNMELFNGMTVLENVMVGFHHRVSVGLLGVALHTRRQRRAEAEARVEALRIMERLGIENSADDYPLDLPYGTQKRVELARALISNPKLLLLDEPTAGMSTQDKQAVAEIIQTARADHGTSVLIVEHDMAFVMPLCDRLTVMNFGRKIAEGLPGTIRHHREVMRAYLGGSS